MPFSAVPSILLDQGLACHEAFARTGQRDACRGNEQAREQGQQRCPFQGPGIYNVHTYNIDIHT